MKMNETHSSVEELIKAVGGRVAELDALAEVLRLATMLHDMTCRFNHTDMCGWDYEDWKYVGSKTPTRDRYIKKVVALNAVADPEVWIKVIGVEHGKL